MGQQCLDKIRQAADLADTHLAGAMRATGADDFDLDTQYVRSAAFVAPPPEVNVADVTAITATVVGTAAITQTKTWWTQPGGSNGKHCK